MIITVSHQKGGVGKSTVVFNLAINIAKNRVVKVVDLDMQKTFTNILKVRKQESNKGKLSAQIKKVTNNIELYSFDKKDEFLTFLKSASSDDLILIDSGGFDSDLNRLSMVASHYLITPVSSDFCELLGIKTYEKILQDLSNNIKLKGRLFKSLILFNKINPNAKQSIRSTYNFVEKSKHFETLKTYIRHRADYKNSVAFGLSVKEHNKGGKADLEFSCLTKELLERISQ